MLFFIDSKDFFVLVFAASAVEDESLLITASISIISEDDLDVLFCMDFMIYMSSQHRTNCSKGPYDLHE